MKISRSGITKMLSVTDRLTEMCDGLADRLTNEQGRLTDGRSRRMDVRVLDGLASRTDSAERTDEPYLFKDVP